MMWRLSRDYTAEYGLVKPGDISSAKVCKYNMLMEDFAAGLDQA